MLYEKLDIRTVPAKNREFLFGPLNSTKKIAKVDMVEDSKGQPLVI